jgi:predicted O-methyltransferase YrrM/predicted acetyltransferase
MVVIRTLGKQDEGAFDNYQQALLADHNPFLYVPAQTDFKAYLAKLAQYELKPSHPDDSTATTYYYFTETGEIAGRISCRWQLEKGNLRKVDGHIGYETAPKYRKRGIATALLRFALEKYRQRGILDVLITAVEGNEASRKTIEKAGGQLDAIINFEENGKIERLAHYWIHLDQAEKTVKSYGVNANPNMRRPVVKPELVEMMRTEQKQLTGFLAEIAQFAHDENVPIIPHETVVYFQFLLQALQPQKILEVGTAIGFSALMMAQASPSATLTTIERNPEMVALAQENFDKFDQDHQIQLIQGEAVDVLANLTETYDFAFMDSAKSKYIVFLPEILNRLSVGGIVVIDDVFQGGDVAKPLEEIKRNQRSIYRGLRKLFEATLKNPSLTATLLPLGDGLLMIRKNNEQVDLG